MIPPLVCKGSLAADGLTGDFSSGLRGELVSALVVGVVGDSASMALRSESDGDSSSVEGGKGMEMLLSVFTWVLPCSQLKAASLYVMGNLGLRILVDLVEQVLWVEVSLLEVESLDIRESDLKLS